MTSFLIYFILTGMICYRAVTKKLGLSDEDYSKLSDEERKKIDELESLIYINFGNFNIVPVIQIMALTLGWILLPYAILSSIYEKLIKS